MQAFVFRNFAYLLLADFHLESNARQAELDLAWASNVPVDDDEDFWEARKHERNWCKLMQIARRLYKVHQSPSKSIPEPRCFCCSMLQHGLCPGQTLWSHKSDMLGLSTGEAQALCRRKKSMSEALESLLDMPGLNRMRNWLHSCVGHLNWVSTCWSLCRRRMRRTVSSSPAGSCHFWMWTDVDTIRQYHSMSHLHSFQRCLRLHEQFPMQGNKTSYAWSSMTQQVQVIIWFFDRPCGPGKNIPGFDSFRLQHSAQTSWE